MATQGPSTSNAPATFVDLTLDDSDEDDYRRKRPRMLDNSVLSQPSAFIGGRAPESRRMEGPQALPMALNGRSIPHMSPFAPMAPTISTPNLYRPPFAGPSKQHQAQRTRPASPHRPMVPPSVPFMAQASHQTSNGMVIDLTASPSPPQTPLPHHVYEQPPPLPHDLPPKTPVCIGQLSSVTALVLYPIPYIRLRDPNSHESEWVPVRLSHEHNAAGKGGTETIHIKSPEIKQANGEKHSGDNFGVVEQKVATSLGPMLGKGLIRLEAKVRKGTPNLPMLPLQILVYTPKGNIPVVGGYLHQCGLLLDHPSYPFDPAARGLSTYHYHNPHNPPPGGHNRALNLQGNPNGRYGGGMMAPQRSQWNAPVVAGKAVEVQRGQVDELFRSLKSGEELLETAAAPEVASTLYPHQKKALTFLLEREHEKPGPDGTYSSLWQQKHSPVTGKVQWVHLVTQKETERQPAESRGAILADDMGLGKTITCVSLIASTLDTAATFVATPHSSSAFPNSNTVHEPPVSAAHFSGTVWGMPETSSSSKGKGRTPAAQEANYARVCRIKTKSRATLILCPLSTVSNWEEQFREHWKGEVTVVGGSGGITCHAATAPPTTGLTSFHDAPPEEKKPARIRSGRGLRVYVYHGNSRKPETDFLADFDAVITTYATLASEFSKQSKSLTADKGDEPEEEEEASDPNPIIGVEFDERGILKLPAPPKKAGTKRKKTGVEVPSALQSIHWFRVVLDEAHCIKETTTVASRASCDLMADRRLCLTGTPVQNKLDDVFALIKFLRIEPFNDKNTWTEFIGTPVKYGQAIGVARLQTIMKCITLRRTKESKTPNGQRILALPPRRDELRYLQFDEKEKEIYDTFYAESKAEFNELSNSGEVMKNYVGILQKILRLRQICDHFELVEGKGNDPQQDPAASYAQTVADIEKDGINVARASTIFSLLRDSLSTQCVECGAELCTAPDGNQGEGDSCEPGSKPKKKTKVAAPSRGPTRPSSPSAPRPIVTRCQHIFCIECYRHSICPGWPKVPAETRRSCSACSSGLRPADAVEVRPDCTIPEPTKKKPAKKEKRQKGMTMENFHPSTKVKALLGDLMPFSQLNPHSVNYNPGATEVHIVDKDGNEVPDGEGPTKTVVFSQWTTMLDKIEDALEMAGIRYDRLDGTMKRDDRTRAMENLKHDPGCEVLLVSLKAGGVGLNLTAAQRVYLMDPYWNPAVENQAVDRIHRLGQTRPVTTIKFIIDNTIEARLLEVQKKKTELAQLTLGSNFSRSELMARRQDELAELFS